MTPLRIVAVDDEPLALDRLSVLLERVDGVVLAGRASGCATGVAAIVRSKPDLVLLDIRMRDGTAFDLLDALPVGASPMIVFVTAFPRFATRAFEVEALDYLLKPVEQERLATVISRARRQLELSSSEQRVADLQRIVEQLREETFAQPQAAYEREIWVRHRGTDRVRVPVAEIDWIGVQDDYACIHSRGREHLLRMSLDRLLQSLNPEEFVRIHRAVAVRADRVEKVTRRRLGPREAVLFDGTKLPVGRVHARSLPWPT